MSEDMTNDNENENDNYNYDKETNEEEMGIVDYQIKIADLESAITQLETEATTIKEQYSLLQKENAKLKSQTKRLEFISKGCSSTINFTADPSAKLAEMTKDKEDLEEMAEKLLNMLTEKEIESNSLRESYEALQIQYDSKVSELNYQIEEMMENEGNKGTVDEIDFNALRSEYEDYKERCDLQLREGYGQEEKMKKEIEQMSLTIHNLNLEIQALEFDNLQSIKTLNIKDQINIDDYTTNEERLSNVVDKHQEEVKALQEAKEQSERKYTILLTQKEEDLKYITEQNANLSKRLTEINREAQEKKDKMMTEINTLTKENKFLNEKLKDITQQKNDFDKKLIEQRILFNQKCDELAHINKSALILKQNKEKSISHLEEKISELNESNNYLINQNKTLLHQVKLLQSNELNSLNSLTSDTTTSNTSTVFNESILIEKENLHLKELLSNQAKELVQMKALRHENETLKTELETLKEEHDTIGKTLENQVNIQMRSSAKFNHDLQFQRKKTLGFKRQCSSVAESNFAKQLAYITSAREKDKEFLNQQIDKLVQQLCHQKFLVANQTYENDVLIQRYRKALNSVSRECKAKDIKLNLNF